MPLKYEIMIDMKGFPWSAPTVTRFGAYDTRSNKKNALKWLIKLAWDKQMITSPVEICLHFAFKPYKSCAKSKRDAMVAGSIKHAVKPDLDNLFKATADCLKGIVILDDNQVFKISAEKYYAESDHIKIIVIDHGV
jgi:Holliday junction resolvase RusA-like endonuclease